MSECVFCESLDESKWIDERLARNDPDPECELEQRYSVAIVKRTFLKGSEGCRGTMTDYGYRRRADGYPLNFCPECGRDLKRKEVRK